MEMSRGDVVVCVVSREYGKPRPAVVMQSDLFNKAHASITVCPVTTDLRDYPLFRIDLSPSPENGLNKKSQAMIDKVVSVPRERIGKRAGALSEKDMRSMDAALKLWLSLD